MIKKNFSKFIFFILFLLCIAKDSICSDYCIILKDGRKIIADDQWYEGEHLIIDVGGANIFIDKDDVEKIIDTQEYIYKNSSEKQNDSQYETDGGVVNLKDGRKFSVRKSWVEDSKVVCLINQKMVSFEKKDVISVQTISSIKNDKVLKNKKKTHNKTFDKDPTTILLKEKIATTKERCDELKKELISIENELDNIKTKKNNYIEYKKSERLKKELWNLSIECSSCKSKLRSLSEKYKKWEKHYYEKEKFRKKIMNGLETSL